MDLSRFDGTYLAVAFVLILLLVLQNWLINRQRAWFGVFVPLAYVGLLVFLGATGRVISLTDFVFAALGLLGLLAWWASAHESRRQKSERDLHLVTTPIPAADFSVSFPPSGHRSPPQPHLSTSELRAS